MDKKHTTPKQASKLSLSTDLDLNNSVKKKKLNHTDFSKCLICQLGGGKLHSLTEGSLASLKVAGDARQDEPWKRLKVEANSEQFLKDRSPVWHPNCRNRYLLKTSYERIKKKRSENLQQYADLATPLPETPNLRSTSDEYDSKVQCVICNKQYDKDGKFATSMIETFNRQHSLMSKAIELNDNALLFRIQGYDENAIDMVANDIRYHRLCMNRYMSRRPPLVASYPKESPTIQPNLHDVNRSSPNTFSLLSDPYESAFQILVERIDTAIVNSAGFFLTTLRDMYHGLLNEHGVEKWNAYRSTKLKKKLKSHYGDKVVFFPQPGGSDFVCSSDISFGTILSKLQQQEEDTYALEEKTIMEAARILRERAKTCKVGLNQTIDELLDVSIDRAKSLVPQTLLNFCCQILTDTRLKLEDSKVRCDSITTEKALILSQQLLYNICGIKSPLSVGIAFDVYNSTRSKTQMTLMNRLNQSVSYDTFHRHLTTIYNDVINIVQEKGYYIPPNMKYGVFTQFAIDNIDWHEKTQDGTTFHATSTIMIQPYTPQDTQEITIEPGDHSTRQMLNGDKIIK